MGRPSAATGRVGLSTRRGGLNGEAIGCYRAGGGLSTSASLSVSTKVTFQVTEHRLLSGLRSLLFYNCKRVTCEATEGLTAAEGLTESAHGWSGEMRKKIPPPPLQHHPSHLRPSHHHQLLKNINFLFFSLPPTHTRHVTARHRVRARSGHVRTSGSGNTTMQAVDTRHVSQGAGRRGGARVNAHYYITTSHHKPGSCVGSAVCGLPFPCIHSPQALHARALPNRFALPRLNEASQRLLFGVAARPKSFCTSSARAEPNAAALRRIAAKPAPSLLESVCCCCCCCCCRRRCCCCCFGCCFAALPALYTFDFRAFEGVSTSLFAQAALPTANCWNAGDPAKRVHRPNQGCSWMR